MDVVRQFFDCPAAAGPAVAATAAVTAVLGLLVLLKGALAILSFLWAYALRPGLSAKRLGPWAAVTGATDGIGKAYCEELAKKGINVLLISRTESKLRDMAAELSTKYKVQARYVAADLTAVSSAKWKELEAALTGVELGLLVNNAGMSYDHAEKTELLEESQLADMVAMNVVSLTKLCQIVLPGMKQRKGGYIVNMGSGSGQVPACPLLSVYAGTKAYVDAFSRALDAEARRHGVRVQCQTPFLVATKLAKIRSSSLTVPSARAYVQAALGKHVGYESSSNPFWAHALMLNALCALMPSRLAGAYIYTMHDSLRRRYYKKVQAQAKAE